VKRVLTRRSSPTTVIACIALFVALGGVSYGVATGSIDSREITDDTIRSKDVRNNGLYSRDLRNNQVYGIDIRNGTIRGRDVARNTLTDDQVAESKLTQVPSAADAARLGGRPADGYALASEPVRLVGTSGQPPFAPGASALGGGDLSPGFWKDGAGTVHLQGALNGPVGGGSLFTLPEGYRPAGRARFRAAVVGSGATTVEIAASGTVSALAADASLDGIAFRGGE
jgi:hypothetical protein